jgi:heterodisulfide reductase subunit B
MQAKINLPSIPIPYFTQLAGLALGVSQEELGVEKLLIPIENVLNQAS